MPSSSSPTKAEWVDRLRPAFDDSMEAVSERITSAASIQRWLHNASFEAAADVGSFDGAQAEAMGYMYMIDDLDAQFPELKAAVQELTDGCGSLDLSWRPLTPNFSRVYVDLGGDYDAKVFARIDAPTRSAVESALTRVARALPSGDPYPNRPHEVTGVVSCAGRCLGVRVRQHLADDGPSTYPTISLLPPGASATDPMRPGDAVLWILDFMDA